MNFSFIISAEVCVWSQNFQNSHFHHRPLGMFQDMQSLVFFCSVFVHFLFRLPKGFPANFRHIFCHFNSLGKTGTAEPPLQRPALVHPRWGSSTTILFCCSCFADFAGLYSDPAQPQLRPSPCHAVRRPSACHTGWLVSGDWGRNTPEKTLLAEAMANWSAAGVPASSPPRALALLVDVAPKPNSVGMP